MRCFEKVSYLEFKKCFGDNSLLYNSYSLPKRATSGSCGYDFFSINDVVIHPGEIVRIPTGYKVMMMSDEVLFIVVRSSMGFKYNVRMCNQVGVIDSDYYDNLDNEGHIWVCLQNEGLEDYVIKRGTAYCQGIFMKYLTCGEDIDEKRISGIGSTNRGD